MYARTNHKQQHGQLNIYVMVTLIESHIVQLLLALPQGHLRRNMLLIVLAEMVHGVLAQCCRGNSR